MFQVKYKSEVINEFEDMDEAIIEAEDRHISDSATFYVYDTETDTRYDMEDWRDLNPNWNDHLEN